MITDFDVLVVGGGINGAAVARDAAGRGARVMVVEKDDIASHTSSASTKLIHGGLRYLEHFEFRLVAEALAERERLTVAAPHLIRPMRFVLPHDTSMRPFWMVRLGLFLYDRLGGPSRLPRSTGVKLDAGHRGKLRKQFSHAYVYSDCWGEDARLTLANLQDAAARGAVIRTRTRLDRAERKGDVWAAHLVSGNATETVTAKVLVNATGAWASRFLPERTGAEAAGSLRLVKGSHIVTRRLFEGDHAYLLQNPDKRVIFAIPFERDFTLIGTTDIPWEGDLDKVDISEDEVSYLCEAVNRCLEVNISRDDVVWSYAGLRPLYDDERANPSAVSRDYVLALDQKNGEAPVLSVLGGKITTHRVVGERATDAISPFLPGIGPAWTATARLPGGDLPDGLGGLTERLARKAPFLPRDTVQRWAESYGDRAFQVLGAASSMADLGEDFGAGLTAAEVEYLVSEEWAVTVDDIVWRRSKLGLRMTAGQIDRLALHLDHRRVAAGTAA